MGAPCTALTAPHNFVFTDAAATLPPPLPLFPPPLSLSLFLSGLFLSLDGRRELDLDPDREPERDLEGVAVVAAERCSWMARARS